MQNLLRFLQRYSNFLLFIVLEVVALLLFVLTQPYQHARFFSAANGFVTSVTQVGDNISGYFTLTRVNRQLAEENAMLREQIVGYQSLIEKQAETDTTYRYAHLRWQFTPAKVVDMQTATAHNYLVINKGSRDNVQEGQGVLSHDGVVGVVSKVNTHFSLVVPLIHPKMNLSCRIMRNRQQGFLHWDGPSSRYAGMNDIGRHIEVREGDTIVTSGLTDRFPQDVMVGVVDKVTLRDGDTNYRISVRLSTDFRSLEYVQIIRNPLSDEHHAIKPQEP